MSSDHWLCVNAHPPKEGQWAIVLSDYQQNYGDIRWKLFKVARYKVHTAVCVGFDEMVYLSGRRAIADKRTTAMAGVFET